MSFFFDKQVIKHDASIVRILIRTKHISSE